MADLVITNTFSAGAKIKASEHNTNWSDVKTWLNNRNQGTDTWTNMKVLGTVANPAEVKSSATSCELDIDCTGSNGTPIVTWRRSGSTLFTVGVDGAASNLLKFGTTSLTTNVAMQIATAGARVQFAAGTQASPGICGLLDTASGLRINASSNMDIITGGTIYMNLASNAITPGTDNSIAIGNTTGPLRYTVVCAVNGTIQTSHSSTKTNIETFLAPDEVEVPEAIVFNRPEDKHSSRQLGFLADNLPEECFAVIDDQGTRSKTDVYTSGVIGLLCAKQKKNEARLAALEAR